MRFSQATLAFMVKFSILTYRSIQRLYIVFCVILQHQRPKICIRPVPLIINNRMILSPIEYVINKMTSYDLAVN